MPLVDVLEMGAQQLKSGAPGILKIPKHLKGEKHGGEAADLPLFAFDLTHLTDGLAYRATKGTHGQIEPAISMLLANYQALLCGTKPN